MRFNSNFSQPRYTIGDQPDYFETKGQHRYLVKGLHAQFRQHAFDSELAQKNERWTDEQREQVEGWLVGHADFGVTLRIMPEFEPIPKTITREADTCIWSIPTTEGVELCGKGRADWSEFYCEQHAPAAGDLRPDDGGKQVRGRVPAQTG